MIPHAGLSSRESGGWHEFVGPSVAEEGPEDVDAAAGQGEDGLDVALAFGSFAFVEPAGRHRSVGC